MNAFCSGKSTAIERFVNKCGNKFVFEDGFRQLGSGNSTNVNDFGTSYIGTRRVLFVPSVRFGKGRRQRRRHGPISTLRTRAWSRPLASKALPKSAGESRERASRFIRENHSSRKQIRIRAFCRHRRRRGFGFGRRRYRPKINKQYRVFVRRFYSGERKRKGNSDAS